MNFLLFNLLFFLSSYALDSLLLPLFEIKAWTSGYFYYLFLCNLPLSTLITYWAIYKLKRYLEGM